VYARSTTIQAQPASVDAGIAHARDVVLPEILAIDGCVGLSMMVDRKTGRCVTTSAWRSMDQMRASEAQIGPIRDRVEGIFGGSNSDVEEWEIVLLHRDHRAGEGAAIRASWGQTEPAQLDHAIDTVKLALHDIEQLDGFCSASYMVSRATGRTVLSVTYDNADALDRNRDKATAIRATRAPEGGIKILDVSEYELAIAHLRVPEMA
jgi:hypothetical protein